MKKQFTSAFATLTAVSTLALLAGCAQFGGSEATRDEYPADSRVSAQFIDAAGDAIGSAIITQTHHGVLFDIELRRLDPGWHGFHIHETGSCEKPDFESAGNHFDPDNDEHGFRVEGGYHAGDFPNVYIDQSGGAQFQVFAERLSLGGENTLLDRDGSALVVHSRPDDYRSQPSGAAGERVACAVLTHEEDAGRL